MKKLGRAIWAFTYIVGTVLATVLIFPFLLIIAIIQTIGNTFEDNK